MEALQNLTFYVLEIEEIFQVIISYRIFGKISLS